MRNKYNIARDLSFSGVDSIRVTKGRDLGPGKSNWRPARATNLTAFWGRPPQSQLPLPGVEVAEVGPHASVLPRYR